MNENIEVGVGNLAGKGIYALRKFNKNDIVVKYSLVPVSETAYGILPEGEKQFTHIHHGQIYLYSEPERFVNHSDNPNTYQDFEIGADRASRDIQAGEMITTDATRDDV